MYIQNSVIQMEKNKKQRKNRTDVGSVRVNLSEEDVKAIGAEGKKRIDVVNHARKILSLEPIVKGVGVSRRVELARKLGLPETTSMKEIHDHVLKA